jgi:hypothetical protein
MAHKTTFISSIPFGHQEKLSHRDKMSEATSLQIYNVFRDCTDDLLAQPQFCVLRPTVIQPPKPLQNLAVLSSRDHWQTVCSREIQLILFRSQSDS